MELLRKKLFENKKNLSWNAFWNTVLYPAKYFPVQQVLTNGMFYLLFLTDYLIGWIKLT
jgi:hypothetical protein